MGTNKGIALEYMADALDYYDNYEDRVAEASDFLRTFAGNSTPEFALVLGSGLGKLASCIDVVNKISYTEIPDFPIPLVPGHEGNLILGDIEGISVLALQGRKHYYEVADEPMNTGILQVVFPVHVLANLGISNYFVTCAAGGFSPEYNVGDLMIIKSHINFIPNPLLGQDRDFKKIDDTQCSRFQPMNAAYNPTYQNLLFEAGKEPKTSIHIRQGVYAALTGPSYETESECIALRRLGADAVGMSTAPEVIAARYRGMNVAGMACITNVIAEDGTNATSHEEVSSILQSAETEQRLYDVVKGFFRLFSENKPKAMSAVLLGE